MTTFSDWLTKEFLAWQMASGKKQTIEEFGDYLGITLGVMNNYLNKGQSPRGTNVEKIADKLGDEIYDVLGLDKPNSAIQEMKRTMPKLTKEQNDYLVEEARKMAAKKSKGGQTNESNA